MMTTEQIERYRDNTKSQTAPGATVWTFRCVRCNQSRKTLGRRRINSRWICGQCVADMEKRSA